MSTHKLSAKWTIDSMQDMYAVFGEAMQEEITKEIDNSIIKKLGLISKFDQVYSRMVVVHAARESFINKEIPEFATFVVSTYAGDWTSTVSDDIVHETTCSLESDFAEILHDTFSNGKNPEDAFTYAMITS